jgi:Domain of unknown function (DUF1707)
VANLPSQAGPPGRPPELRVSDADREQVAETLRHAAGEGRLTMDELDERLGAAYAAKTFSDLTPLTSDLPGVAGSRPGPAAPVPGGRVGGTATSHVAIAVMGGFARKGPWVAPRKFTAFTLMGGGSIDLREARFSEPVLTIYAVTIMGGIEIICPEDVEVVVHQVPIMGGVDGPKGITRDPPPGAPRVEVWAVAVMGGVDVKVKPPKGESKRKRRQLGQG